MGIDKYTRDFYTLLSVIKVSSKQKMSKDVELNNVINQLDLTAVYNIPTNNERIHIIFKYT